MTKTSKQSKFVVYLLVFVAILCWGVSFLWTDKLVNLGIPVFYFVFLRSVIAGIVLLLISLCTGTFQVPDGRDVPKFLLLALLQPFIYFLAESFGIQQTGSPTVSSMLIASSPLFCIAAGRIFFGERISVLNFIGILVAIGGICLMVFSRGHLGPHYLIGILLLVVAVCSEAGHATVTKKLSLKYSNQTIVMYQFLFGSVYLLPLFLTLGLKGFEPRWLGIEVWYPIICLGVLCSALAFTFWINAIRHLGVARSSMISTLIPVVSALAAMVIGREILSPRQWAGIIIAVTGVALSQRVGGRLGAKMDERRNNISSKNVNSQVSDRKR
ncbi:MAG: DMT family transporter [Bacteroidales bacterium]|nr:DMT family transporter [Bacteroidales bacterium]